MVQVTEPTIGDSVASKYIIDGVIGRGGMGVVFSARHSLTDRRVALKWMTPDPRADVGMTERFLREARAMGRIEHASVVGVLDVGEDQGAPFLVMDYLQGTSLRAYIVPEGIAHSRAIGLVMPALEGVEAAHRAGVVHRDLKPENLFVVVDSDGQIQTTKVLDFGISKLRDDALHEVLTNSPITHTGMTLGTPRYMSPEQIRGTRGVDGRTDIWAMGIILYEMLAGRVPFRGDSYGELSIAIATEPHAPLTDLVPGLPTGVAAVVHRALAKDANDRFESIASFAEALQPFAPTGVRFRAPTAAASRFPTPTQQRAIDAAPRRGTPAARLEEAETLLRENRTGATTPIRPALDASAAMGEKGSKDSFAQSTATGPRSSTFRRAILGIGALTACIVGVWVMNNPSHTPTETPTTPVQANGVQHAPSVLPIVLVAQPSTPAASEADAGTPQASTASPLATSIEPVVTTPARAQSRSRARRSTSPTAASSGTRARSGSMSSEEF